MVREIVEVVLCTSFVIAYCEWLTLVCNVTFSKISHESIVQTIGDGGK